MCFTRLKLSSSAPLQEILIAARLFDVFGADVKALHHDAIAHRFGEFHADRCPRHVEHTARATLIEFVRHAFQDGGVDVDIDIVANFEDLKIRGDICRTLLPEALSEEIASVCALSVRADHVEQMVSQTEREGVQRRNCSFFEGRRRMVIYGSVDERAC